MSRTTSRLPATVASLAAAAALAACGSTSSSSTVSTARPSQAQLQQAQQDAVRFARCVRTHGVPSFPDPTSPSDLKASVSASEAQSPAFRSAATACRHILRGSGSPSQSAARSQAQKAAILAFAHCLRGHGFPNFPDPTPGGEVTHEMLANAGINLHQPGVVSAADACVAVTHGVITRAAVARFVAGQ